MTHTSVVRLVTRFALAPIACLLVLAFTACTTQHMVDITPTTAPTKDATPAPAAAKSIAGKWTAEFDTQIGLQKYTYEFKLDGGKLSGTATGQIGDDAPRPTVTLTDCKLDGNAISFGEPLSFNGTDIPVVYTGTVTGDTMQLHRAVGDIATEEVVLKRAM